MKPTQEQIKEFWKWCGIEFKHIKGEGVVWYDKVKGDWYYYAPDIDLNNLFKYAVPKLQDKGIPIEFWCFEHRGFRVTAHDLGSFDSAVYHSLAEVKDEDPALALFWALFEVMKDESKN